MHSASRARSLGSVPKGSSSSLAMASKAFQAFEARLDAGVRDGSINYRQSERLRAGFASGSALYYVTGGGAKAKIENSFRTTNGANSFTETVNDDEADGYQLGAGVEWRLAPNLSLTGEYLFTNLQPGDYVVRVGPGTAGPTNPFILAPNTAGTISTPISLTVN